MKFPWFKRTGFFYLPVTIIGWMIVLMAVSIAVYQFIQIDSVSHSVSDTLINFIFQGLIIGAIYTFLGWLTSKRASA